MTSDSNCNIIEHLNRDFEKWQEKDNSDLIYLLEVIRPTFSHLSQQSYSNTSPPFFVFALFKYGVKLQQYNPK